MTDTSAPTPASNPPKAFDDPALAAEHAQAHVGGLVDVEISKFYARCPVDQVTVTALPNGYLELRSGDEVLEVRLSIVHRTEVFPGGRE